MTPVIDTDRETMRQLVRGERPLSDLHLVGMKIEDSTEGRLFCVSRPVPAIVTIHDLARGFLTHKNDVDELKEWAFFIESADIDIDGATHPLSETLQNAIWQASFGEPVDARAIEAIEQLVGRIEKTT